SLRRLRRRQLLEPLHAAFDGRQEPFLFGARGIDDVLRALLQLGIRVPHHVDYDADDLGERGLALTEQPGMTDSATQNAPQDVATPFIRRKYTVSEKKRYRATVICDDAKRAACFPAIVFLPSSLLHRLDERLEEIVVKVVLLAL